MKKTILFVLGLFCLGTIHAQTVPGRWLLELKHNDIGTVRTIMQFNIGPQAFEAHTREHADKKILGGWTAFLGRTFTKNFKHGSLLRIINGKTSAAGDTLKLDGIFTSPIGNYYFRGFTIGNVMEARLLDGSLQQVGTMKGNPYPAGQPLEDYAALTEKALALTAEKIYNRQVLLGSDYKKFTKRIEKVSLKVQDDLEMVFAFFYYAGKLPVTHYALMKIPAAEKEKRALHQLMLEEKSAQAACLKINSFGGTAKEVDSVFEVILKHGYSNLVVDLRGNPGGTVEAGMAFASRVTDSAYYGGIFLTQKWFNHHSDLPRSEEYEKFPHFSAANFDMIIKGIHNTEGLCLKVIPAKEVYRGKLFILTDGQTASTCEPLVYALKQYKRAIVVGEKTAGAMMNGEIFELDKGFKLVVPTADYYTADGYKIDKKGVLPNVQVKATDALEYTLKNLVK
jgi:hypothetical protein